MARKLILPDIHNDFMKAEAIIDYVQPNTTHFVGDYWDNFHDNPSQAFNTAIWLANRIKNHPEDTFGLGNHDMPYVWGLEMCSGFTKEKAAAIDTTGHIELFREHLKLFTLVDFWLVSHAGLTKQLVPKNEERQLFTWLSHECTRAKLNFKEGISHWSVKAGMDRGGRELWGGLTWCDYKNFRPIKGIKQVFGHTKGYLPRHNGDNHCIDTALKHYAIIEDGKLTVYDFNAQVMLGIKN